MIFPQVNGSNSVAPLRRLYSRAISILPDRAAVQIDYLMHHRRLANLERPSTFNEKIQYRKLYDRDPRLPQLADKILAKEYVGRVLGSEWVIPTIWAGDKLPPQANRKWQIPYVLKANNGSGWNYFVLNERDQDWKKIERLACRWMSTSFGTPKREWLYSQIRPQLLVEKYCGSSEGVLPTDFKFFVFAGRVHYVQVDTARASNHKRCFYDRDWIRQPFALRYPAETTEVPRPYNLERLIGAAERLCSGLPFVRADFYEIGTQPLFGEMTFYPGAGDESFTPTTYDEALGRLWPI